MADEKIVIKIEGDNKNLDKALKNSQSKLSRLRATATKLRTGIATAAKAGAVAFIGLTAAVGRAISVYRTQEQAEIRTRKTIEATGGAAGLAAEEIFKMASELQGVTTFGDEAIISGQNLLLTFRNIGKDVFPRATEAMLDMSTAMGTGLKESAIQLGKALNDPVAGISALTRVGITFTEQQKETIKTLQRTGDTAGAQTIILAELENQFGGVSRAAVEGTGGLIQLQNTLGDIQEEIGKVALPAVLQLTKAFKKLLPSITSGIRAFGELITPAKESTKKVEGLGRKITVLKKKISNLREGIKDSSDKGFFGNFFDKRDPVKLNAALEQNIKKLKELRAERDAIRRNETPEDLEAEAKAKAAAEKLAAIQKRAADNKAQAKRDELALIESIEAEFAANKEELKEVNKELETAEEEERIALLQERLKLTQQLEKGAQIKRLAQDKKFDTAKSKLQQESDKREIASQKARLQTQKAYTDASLSLANNLSNLSVAIAGKQGKALFLIQKAAAIAQAVVSTQLAAVQALAVPPAPNVGLAAVATAAGAANIATIAATAVQGFAKGGLVQGGVPGVDSVPAMLQRNELVVPSKNFEDVIASFGGNVDGEGQKVEVMISMSDNLIDFVEAGLAERSALDTGV